MDRRQASPVWWGEGLKFSCKRCGACCGGSPGAVWFTEDEAFDIAEFLGLDLEGFLRAFVWNKYGRPSFKEKENYDCVFLDDSGDSKKCLIYDHRPSQCRTFPFWHDVVETESAWRRYARDCPGMDSGELYDESAVLERLSRNEN